VILGLTRRKMWVLLVAICVHRMGAMDPDRKMSQYVRDRWGSDQGLAGEVHAITQTNDGYLWVGTDRGLFRFDGFSFRPVSDQSPSPVSILNVAGVTVDTQGYLMVRLPERNLLRYADGRFENMLYSLQPRELAITAMCGGRDGDTLITGLVQGVLRYRKGKFETVAPISFPPFVADYFCRRVG